VLQLLIMTIFLNSLHIVPDLASQLLIVFQLLIMDVFLKFFAHCSSLGFSVIGYVLQLLVPLKISYSLAH
jgi:hypothetical protein